MILAIALAATSATSSESLPVDIIVTATHRPQPLSQVPIAASVVDGEAFRSSGAVDVRGLNQFVPSLLLSSSSNEAGGAGARIRGVGTVGDNAGLESSVATYVDGVYRSRAAVGLSELGPVDRIEVLRGPQGTLYGRNASAGLINVVTAAPGPTLRGYVQASYGNYRSKRLEGGITGPLSGFLTGRVDGVWFKRNGFVEDVVSGRRLNGRDRWQGRAKLRWTPDSTLTFDISFDYAKRDEECCAGIYLPSKDLRSSTPGSGGGSLLTAASTIAALIRSQGGDVLDSDPYARKVALTSGQSFRQDVDDHGAALTVSKDFGWSKLVGVSGWRSNVFIKGQDADFSSLDLTQRPSDGSGYIRFRNLSQEVRLNGRAFGERIDWLIGGYVGDERLTLQDNLRYGADYDRFASARVGALGGNFAAFPSYGFANLEGFARAFGGDALAAVVQNVPITGTGELDRWRQHDSNQAIFTHDIVRLTDRLSLTVGARWTRDGKTLNADLSSSSSCGIYVAIIQRLRALASSGGPSSAATLANSVLAPLTGYPCNINSISGAIADRRAEQRWSGTAALTYRIAPGLTSYTSWSHGYKAGGFNLDRAALLNSSTLSQLSVGSLQFKPETVDSFEIGARLHRYKLDLAVTFFESRFRNFQLNTYTGTNFLVSNIQGCGPSLGSTDRDNIAGNSQCGDAKAGVISRGVEVEGTFRPAADVIVSGGFTYADTRYARDLAGSPDPVSGNNSLQPVLFLLPGSSLSNAPAYVATGSVGWTPRIGQDWRATGYADVRWQGRIVTGSDLVPEKAQGAFATVNARIGLTRADRAWSIELWAQNIFDRNYLQVAFSEPLQGGGSAGLPGTAAAVAAYGTTSSQLYGAFLGEPRTWGLTVARRF